MTRKSHPFNLICLQNHQSHSQKSPFSIISFSIFDLVLMILTPCKILQIQLRPNETWFLHFSGKVWTSVWIVSGSDQTIKNDHLVPSRGFLMRLFGCFGHFSVNMSIFMKMTGEKHKFENGLFFHSNVSPKAWKGYNIEKYNWESHFSL